MKLLSGITGVLYLFITFTLQINVIYAQQVELKWNRNSEFHIASYSIYRAKHIDSTFTMIDNVTHPDTTYIDQNVMSLYYCYAVTAIDSNGNESNFSNIVEVDIPATPVELSTFTAYTDGNNAVLEWSTTSESNNYGFEIQRCVNMNSDFKRIGFENGNGTTSEPRLYQFVDRDLPEGTYIYRLKQIDFDGTSVFSHTAEVTIGLPADFELYQNYPNPFNPITTISYSLPHSGHVELSIYNVKGEKVSKLVDEYQKSGKYEFQWNARDWNGTEVSSGIYYVQIKALNTTQFRKMTLMR